MNQITLYENFTILSYISNPWKQRLEVNTAYRNLTQLKLN